MNNDTDIVQYTIYGTQKTCCQLPKELKAVEEDVSNLILENF